MVDVAKVRVAIHRMHASGMKESAEVIWDLLDEWMAMKGQKPTLHPGRGVSFLGDSEAKWMTIVGADENEPPGPLCDFCKKHRGTMREDPYQAEINDDHSLVLMCDDCEKRHADDI